MAKFFKWLSIVVIGLIALVVFTAAVALVLVDSPPVKHFITDRIGNTLGRKVTVAGDMNVDWSLQPLVTLNKIKLANASWGKSPYMAEIEKLAFSIDLTALLQWRVVFPSIDIDRPRVHLARSGKGETNWAFLTQGKNKGGQATIPVIKALAVDNGEFSFRDPGLKAAPILASLKSLEAEIDKQARRLTLKGSGSIEAKAFTLDINSELRVGADGGKTPINLQATLADATMTVDGTVTEPASLTGLNANVLIDVPEPSALAGLADRNVKPWPPFHLEAQLMRDGQTWRLEDMNSQLGESQLSGSIAYDGKGEIPRITADLNAPRIDLVQILPGSSNGADDNPAQQGANSRIPDIGFRTGLLNKVNADIHFESASIVTSRFNLEDALLDATLKAGHLEIKPITFDIAGGGISATLDMQAGDTPVQTQLAVEVDTLDLGYLLTYFSIDRQASGRIDGQIELSGQGDGLQQFMQNADGSLSVTLSNSQLANASWAEAPYMARVEKLAFTLDMPELVQGRFVFPSIDIDRPRVHLARSAEGESNWAFLTQKKKTKGKKKDGGQSTIPVIHSLAIDNGELSYRNPGLKAAPIMASIDSLKGTIDNEARSLSLNGSGAIADKAFTLDVNSQLNEGGDGSTIPLNAKVELGDATVKVDGTVSEPASLKGIDAQVAIDVPEPSTLAAVAGRDLKPWPAFHLEAQLMRDGETWRLEDLDSRWGQSQLNGSIGYARGSQPPLITANLYAPKIDLVQLLPNGGGNTEQKTTGPVIPDIGFRRGLLNKLNTDIHFETPSLYTSSLRLDNIVLDTSLEDGHLMVDPLKVDIAGGGISATLDMQAGDIPVQTRLGIDTNKLDLRKVFAGANIKKEGFGIVNSQIELAGAGDRLPDFLANADGDIALIMQEGRIDQMLVELIGQSAPGMLGSMFGKNQGAVALRCLISDWKVNSGTANIQRLIVDTPELKIVGDGEVNLATEHMDIELLPRNKDFSLLSSQAPVNIAGSFANPKISVDRSAAVTSLLTPMELGVGENAECRELAEAARRSL